MKTIPPTGSQGRETPSVREAAGPDVATRSSAQARRPHRWTHYLNRVIAGEISTLTRYCSRLVQWMPRDSDTGALFDAIDAPTKLVVSREECFREPGSDNHDHTVVLLNGTFNHHYDIQGLLLQLKEHLSSASRVVVVLYNPYLRFLYVLANRFGFRKGELPGTFITRVDMANLAALAGFSIVKQRTCGYCPWRLLGLGDVINRWMRLVPLLRWLSFTYIVTLRPIVPRERPGLTCVIPARNERGNIEDALRRFPALGCPLEIIFVEGHSNDGTWEEIQRVAKDYTHLFRIKTFQQSGRGKADAVRLGFQNASEPVLTILDADLTMPPEMLTRFYDAYCQGQGDFINGSRLVYPMEGEAMRFLNRLGNVFFAKALSWVLDNRFGDSLCGTKLLARSDYARIQNWRRDFGDFDPFGDFELLFPAAVLGLGTVDIPVRYMARTYGSTNISRFRNGVQLLRMTLIGFFRIKLGS